MNIALDEDFLAKGGLPTTPYADDYLSQATVEVYFPLFLPGDKLGIIGGQ